MQGGQGQDWGYLVPMDRLNERYDKVKVPESLGKSQFTRKEGQPSIIQTYKLKIYLLQMTEKRHEVPFPQLHDNASTPD